eukprot:CAMPEP_0184473278 /NCGR_PEP_ID=MMETSP0740-20130409/121416_1 /TAXON_ID=385413 /ORGANISM="Thalassiosira miniscula, Strain CCMP1093" /LENGTH=185 /DNA_ID=CAMNT_0026850157 /DNA_START=165 /DNA_END=720 /DNA_ORIENTATION=+
MAFTEARAVNLANFSGTPTKIPDPTKGTHAAFRCRRHCDVRPHPVFGVGDHNLLVLVFAFNRIDHTFDFLADGDVAGFAILGGVIGHRLTLHANDLTNKNLKQTGGAFGFAAEDIDQRVVGLRTSAIINEQRHFPVATAHHARDLDQQADVQARKINVAILTFVNAHAAPCLTMALCGRMQTKAD